MPSVTTTRHIAAPIERVFEVFTSLEQAAANIRGIDRVDLLTPGPFGLGTRWKETRTMLGKQATEEMWITEFDPPRAYTAEAESCGAHYRTVHRFAPEGAGTRVEMEFGARPVTWVAKLFSPLSFLMMGSLRKMMDHDLADLQQVCERFD